MSHIIAYSLPSGFLLEGRNKFDTINEAKVYLDTYWKQLTNTSVFIMNLDDNDQVVFCTEHKFNIHKYYSCEDGVYFEEHYEDLDQGQGIKEIGTTYLVNITLVPDHMDGEMIEEAIEAWINRHYILTNPEKPIWLF